MQGSGTLTLNTKIGSISEGVAEAYAELLAPISRLEMKSRSSTSPVVRRVEETKSEMAVPALRNQARANYPRGGGLKGLVTERGVVQAVADSKVC